MTPAGGVSMSSEAGSIPARDRRPSAPQSLDNASHARFRVFRRAGVHAVHVLASQRVDQTRHARTRADGHDDVSQIGRLVAPAGAPPGAGAGSVTAVSEGPGRGRGPAIRILDVAPGMA